jgi:uncharacterized membrane protein
MSVSVPTRELIAVRTKEINLSLNVGALAMLSMVIRLGPVCQALEICALCILMGACLSHRLFRRVPLAHRVPISLGLGFLLFLLVGALLGSVLPLVGVATPLTRLPDLIAWLAITGGVSVVCLVRRVDPVRETFAGVTSRDACWALVLGVLPALSLVGAARLNAAGGSEVADVTVVLAVLLVIVAVLLPIGHRGPPRILLLFFSMVAIAWQGPPLGGWVAGYDTQHEYYVGHLAISQGVFPLMHYSDPYAGMLSLTVFPAQMQALLGVNLRSTMVLAPSIFLGLALLATWATLRERLGVRQAALFCSLFVVGSGPLLRELPGVTRQCYALFFFALLIMAIISVRMSPTSARWLAAISGIGIAVTHYSSAYLAAGAVIVGCLLTIAMREPQASRILTIPVATIIVGAAVGWGGYVARTGSSIGEALTSIRAEGFQFAPGGGSIFAKWLHASSTFQLVNVAKVIRTFDLHLRETRYRWMQVPTAAAHVPLRNDSAPTAHGVAVLGPLLSIGGIALAELLLAASVVSVLICVWRCRSDRKLCGITGMAIFFLAVSALSRFSQTLGLDFGPSRVQAQAYLLFVIVVALLFEGRLATRLQHWMRRSGVVARMLPAIALVAGFAVATGGQLTNLLEPGASLPAALITSGELSQRLLSPYDIETAQWISANARGHDLIQADRFGQLALYDYGYSINSNSLIGSVDPVIVDNRSWVFAYHTNVLLGSARGGNNAFVGGFRFPGAYFQSTRSILWVSPTDVVYGPLNPTVQKRR